MAAYFVAMDPWRNNSYDNREACIVFGGLPRGTAMEEVTNPTTYWPLGFLCKHGDAVIAWQNWPATIVSYSSWLVVLVLVVVMAVALLRWRFESPRMPAIGLAVGQELTRVARSIPVLVGLVIVLGALAVTVALALIGT